MSKPADRWIDDLDGPSASPGVRFYGTLDVVADSERRALRPIGSSAQDVARRTAELLGRLEPGTGVRVFQGVRPSDGGGPRIPHALITGQRVVLIESVAWPPGCYTLRAGQVHCDGIYIGQSVRPLLSSVRCWRGRLPSGHRVSALVVVYEAAPGQLDLPGQAGPLCWSAAAQAARLLHRRVARAGTCASPEAVDVLADAVDEPARR